MGGSCQAPSIGSGCGGNFIDRIDGEGVSKRGAKNLLSIAAGASVRGEWLVSSLSDILVAGNRWRCRWTYNFWPKALFLVSFHRWDSKGDLGPVKSCSGQGYIAEVRDINTTMSFLLPTPNIKSARTNPLPLPPRLAGASGVQQLSMVAPVTSLSFANSASPCHPSFLNSYTLE